MNKTAIAGALLTLSLGANSFAIADEATEIALLNDRIEKLEAKKEASQWLDNVTLSGAVEVEASYIDPDSGSSESDIVVATVELGVAAAITDNIETNIVFLYEEDGDGVEVDVATMGYQLNNSGFSFLLGQDYVPFGSYETHLVNDTLALEIGEARETAFAVNYEAGLFGGSFYIFNGDNLQDEGEHNTIQNFGARIGLSGDNFTVGADYISNLADSDSLQDNDYGYDSGEDAVAGASFYASANFSNITLLAEYLTALDEFAVDGANSEPEAMQLEAAIEMGAFTYALSYQETDEALFIELPEERISFGVSTEIFDGIGLGVQLQRDSDYSIEDSGSGDDINSVVVQLAAEF
jgi:hypothetical protein